MNVIKTMFALSAALCATTNGSFIFLIAFLMLHVLNVSVSFCILQRGSV